MKLTRIIPIMALTASIAAPAQNQTNNGLPASNDWEYTDGVGRAVRSADAAPQRRTDKFVGMFYWTWHQGDDDTRVDNKNITAILREHPDAINDYNHPAWGGSLRPGVFYWDEPLFGFYRTTDPWVLRRHAEMLADADIDVIFMDCTNGTFLWEASHEALLQVWSKAKSDGVNVPKIAFMLPFSASDDTNTSLRNLYRRLYKNGRYKDMWFYWDGKPMIMAHPGRLGTTDIDAEIRNFFTFRGGQPDYVNGGGLNSVWGWLEVYPQHCYTMNSDGSWEQTTVGVAQNARDASGGHCCAFTLPNTYGRSYSKLKGFDTRPDAYLYGYNFEEQWTRAQLLNVEMIFVTGWNEWTSGMWTSAHGWSDPLSFVDQFDWDHSRDIEPCKGWGDKADAYYGMLLDNVRRFKGMREPQQKASAPKTIVLGGDAAQWADVTPRYVAYRGNTMHRKHAGRYSAYYTNNTGRNDISGAQVAHDADYLYFRVETASALTPATDQAWMRLFIDTDRDKSTGWYGYDYALNINGPDGNQLRISHCIGSKWLWMPAGKADFVVNGNVLEVAVPKSALKLSGDIDFEFKWSDNMQTTDNIMDFYVNGDCAPGGRFNYRFRAADPSSAIDEIEADASALPAEYYSIQGVRLAEPPASGLYIERRGGKVVKKAAR